jgi:hypothetical protein
MQPEQHCKIDDLILRQLIGILKQLRNSTSIFFKHTSDEQHLKIVFGNAKD